MSFPGENTQFAERVVPPRPLPQPIQETAFGPGHRSHAHTGRQLVQEPAPKRPRCLCKEQVSEAKLRQTRTKKQVKWVGANSFWPHQLIE